MVAVTDRYAVYSIFKVHQYCLAHHCLAHLVRDFRIDAERDGPDKELGSALKNELKTACPYPKEYGEDNTTLAIRNRGLGRHKKRMKFYLEDAMANGSDDLSHLSENLLDDLVMLKPYIWWQMKSLDLSVLFLFEKELVTIEDYMGSFLQR